MENQKSNSKESVVIRNKIKIFQQELGEATAKLGASVGIGYSHSPSILFDDLLNAADQACYKAKSEGKGIVCLKEVTD